MYLGQDLLTYGHSFSTLAPEVLQLLVYGRM
mgnify:CR=1 FL=1